MWFCVGGLSCHVLGGSILWWGLPWRLFGRAPVGKNVSLVGFSPLHLCNVLPTGGGFRFKSARHKAA